jgi:hypothetical protein
MIRHNVIHFNNYFHGKWKSNLSNSFGKNK